MHYKYQFDRPRPSQISPLLMPPIEVPGHASYPSGHATESWLLTGLLTEIMPAQAAVPLALVAERWRATASAGSPLLVRQRRRENPGAASTTLLLQCPLVQTLMEKAGDEWALDRSV